MPDAWRDGGSANLVVLWENGYGWGRPDRSKVIFIGDVNEGVTLHQLVNIFSSLPAQLGCVTMMHSN